MTKTTDNAIATAVTTVGILAVAGATLIGVLLALPDSANPATTITIVIGFLGTIITTMLNALLGTRANKKLDRVLNGEMDNKIARVVREVVPEIVHQVLDERTTAGASPGTTRKKPKA